MFEFGPYVQQQYLKLHNPLPMTFILRARIMNG